MSRALSTVLSLAVLLTAVLPATANDGTAPAAAGKAAPPAGAEAPRVLPAAGEVVPGEVVVKFRDEAEGTERVRARGLAVAAAAGASGRGLPAIVGTSGRPVEQVLTELRSDPTVEYAEPSYRVHLVNEGSTTGVPVNDPQTGGQYSLDRMRVRDAWSITTGGSGVIAVLDTGVQADHPDLAGRVLPGRDFVNNDHDASDDNAHGTWVAGIIAANANDGYGIAGVSWTDRILPVKIMNSSGTGSTTGLINGIVWAADNGATVINMSVGGFPYSQAVQDAVNYAWSKGIVLVGAAGNNNREERFYPASLTNVISVSATQREDEFSFWSSYGPAVDVSAPGSSVLTTNCTAGSCPNRSWGSHTYISGTSFATPNVAGVVALIRAQNPTWTPQQVVDRLYATVDDLGYAGWDNRYGRGRVNAYRALGASVPQPTLSGLDGYESNNGINRARLIPLGAKILPTLYPAGDVDYFAVDVPRAGRLDVRVTGVVDTRAYPWHRSSLKIDPIVELLTTSGTVLTRVDAVWEDGTELAQVTVGAPTRILIRITNYFANGNKTAYSVTPTFVDTVPPVVVGQHPAPGAGNLSYDGTEVRATFNEPVTGISTSTFRVHDGSTFVPATVSWDAASSTAVLRPTRTLVGEVRHTVTLDAGIRDASGNALAATSWSFVTGRTFPRVAGADRYATAAAVSASAYPTGVPVVYVATGDAFPDALAAGPAAKVSGGPLLLVKPNAIPGATQAELTRLRPGRIVVAGGPGAVSDGVLAALQPYTTGSVTRLAGVDRYATAAAISRASWAGGASTVYVATGANYPDALAAGAIAARNNAPILLTAGGHLPAATAAELHNLRPARIVLIGGSGVVSDAVAQQLGTIAPVQRISGIDRYVTAVALSQATYAANGVSHVFVATGQSFPDGLAVGPLAGAYGAPLLLVPGNRLPPEVAAELARLDPTNVVLIGGSGVLTDGVRNAIRAVWP